MLTFKNPELYCNEQEQTIWQFVILQKQVDISAVFYAFYVLLIMNSSLHCQAVCGSTRLSPHGSTMLWQNSWSVTGQTHEKVMSIC